LPDKGQARDLLLRPHPRLMERRESDHPPHSPRGDERNGEMGAYAGSPGEFEGRSWGHRPLSRQLIEADRLALAQLTDVPGKVYACGQGRDALGSRRMREAERAVVGEAPERASIDAEPADEPLQSVRDERIELGSLDVEQVLDEIGDQPLESQSLFEQLAGAPPGHTA